MASDFRIDGASREVSSGAALGYIKGLSEQCDLSANLSGSFPDYPMKRKEPFNRKSFLLETSGLLHFKLRSDRRTFTPYLSGGIGASKYQQYFGLVLPAGIGVQGKLRNDAFIMFNALYSSAVSGNTTNHFRLMLGLAGNIGKRKKKKLPSTPSVSNTHTVEKDTDGDGIKDDIDECATVPGLAQFKGCPDSDQDGIINKEDSCPHLAGIMRLHGCPVPDSDHDGLNDENDSCPLVPGLTIYNGCPEPDRDRDGVKDEADKCPDIPGPAANAGCPYENSTVAEQLNLAAKNILFETGSYELITTSRTALNQIVQLLRKYKELKIQVAGHTDNIGSKQSNLLLSRQRANAIKTYLINGGIEPNRLESEGFGDEFPIDTNNTVQGRTRNRRVEIKVRND